MKQKHILNIGYPRCGTTWCWRLLEKQSWFSFPREKENFDLIAGVKTVEEYVLDYIDYDITANFVPWTYAVDRYLINQLSKIESLAVSMILRNPYEFYWSFYNFSYKHNISFNDATKSLISQGWVNQFDLIISRWKNVFSEDRFKIFFYDDLLNDSSKFFYNYCEQMNLPPPEVCKMDKLNATSRTIDDPNRLDIEVVNIINNSIDSLQSLLGRDISHWKK